MIVRNRPKKSRKRKSPKPAKELPFDKIPRDFKGIWIPKEIWINKNLTVMEKLFLIEVNSLDDGKGCFASNEHFANLFDLTKGRCSQILRSLDKKGYIKIVRGNQTRTILGGFNILNLGFNILNLQGGIPLYSNSKLLRNLHLSVEDKKPLKKETTPKRKKSKKITPFLKIAKQLSKIISSHKNINCNARMESWANEIRLLAQNDLNIGNATFSSRIERMNKALAFYKENIGGEYIPVIESGKSFRSKFLQLEAAMERSKGRNNGVTNKQSKPKVETTPDLVM